MFIVTGKEAKEEIVLPMDGLLIFSATSKDIQ